MIFDDVLLHDCFVFQGLGVPFNIASYAMLTHMIAHVTGLKVSNKTQMYAWATHL